LLLKPALPSIPKLLAPAEKVLDHESLPVSYAGASPDKITGWLLTLTVIVGAGGSANAFVGDAQTMAIASIVSRNCDLPNCMRLPLLSWPAKRA